MFKSKKLVLFLCLLLIGTMFLTACGGGAEDQDQTQQPAQDNQEPAKDEKPLQVGIVLSTGGKGDKSFNDAAIAGLEKAKEELGIEYKDIEPREMAQDEESLRFLAEQGMDLVIGVGFLMEEPLRTVAQEFPDTKFAIIDAVVDEKNVASLTFKEHEGSFLAGALAALMTESNTVGFVGGMKIPLIEKFEAGYKHGVEYINETEGKNVNVVSAYAGTTGAAFNDPATGKELTLSHISQGADIVYHASGGTGQGVFEAASEKGKFAIGVDSNQNWMYPGTIIASMLKRVDVAVFDTVKAVKEDTYKAGLTVFGIDNEGVGLTDLANVTELEKSGVENDEAKIATMQELKDKITDEVKAKIKEIEDKINSGEIVVREE
ncbi:BMP family lipoprotein [Alkaliphilus hydrothermalis]|uniref:Basic membrane protein A n=1 Tax=Alkaliphilus hydrothermalis TaxID=1482730 RepID=A0ABS2NMA8_9FIRM|nr:BMP family ABC transporter substrate-binding protein [Alkaliphilus hydrothermalis]MBM7614051.1 basic membrane protein A [Alkaliphilus hydrothermalis]